MAMLASFQGLDNDISRLTMIVIGVGVVLFLLSKWLRPKAPR